MAKIIYGVCGEGMGHATRSLEVINHLLSQGHEVKVAGTLKSYEFLSQYLPVVEITGQKLIYKNNAVKYLTTAYKNFLKTPAAVRSLDRLNHLCNDFKPDLIITDFEPLTAAIANLKPLPFIAIDNQHLIGRAKNDIPGSYQTEYLAARAVVRLMAFGAKAYLITSFFSAEPKDKKTTIYPPILRQAILDLRPRQGDYVLVYLYTSVYQPMIEILKTIKQPFIIYGLGAGQPQANLIFKDFSHQGWLKDFAACRAIIANAGSSLIGEALHLRKPYLALPISGQFEQILNAHYVAKLGYGQSCLHINQVEVKKFLSRLPIYEKNLANYPRVGNEQIFTKIDELVAKYS